MSVQRETKERGGARREPVSLVNASAERLFVEGAGGRVVKLPRVPQPEAVPSPKGLIADRFDAGGAPIGWVPGQEIVFTVNVPPVASGVLYVVEPEVLAQFPHREDFVCAALYGYVERVPQARRKKGKKKRLADAPRHVAVLAAVTRTPYAAAAAGTPSLDDVFARERVSREGGQ